MEKLKLKEGVDHLYSNEIESAFISEYNIPSV